LITARNARLRHHPERYQRERQHLSHSLGGPRTAPPAPGMTVAQKPEPIAAIGIVQQSTADER
jgi:hypothetical protein